MIPKYSIHAILEALALQQQRGETSLLVTIEPGLIPEAMHALRGYRKIFAPFLPGVTDTAPIVASYEQMRALVTKFTILLLVECQTMEEFRETLSRLPIRNSSEWRAMDDGPWDSVL